MPMLPRDVKKAVALLGADPERSIDELAAACGVARRTLEKHFRRFVGRSPSEVRHALLLERFRHELLRAQPKSNVTKIAMLCGVHHLGRFAAAYRKCYGESPSVTLRRRCAALERQETVPAVLSPTLDRPVVAVHSFELIGARAHRLITIADEIAIVLLRDRWLSVGPPRHARYHLRGKVREDGARRLRILVMLTDAASARHIWADRWEGELDDVFAFEQNVAIRVASAIGSSVRSAEIQRASHADPAQLGAWELTMRALPRALLIQPAAQAEALELLERAMDLAPQDALPMALAAWCHAQRGSHHLGPQPDAEKQAGRELALRASRLNACDPKVEALLAAAHTLAQDFEAASTHCDRALALDGACVWGWNRSGMLHLYHGRATDAIECFQFARALGPDDPLNFFCSIGIGSAHFEVGRYEEAARWFTRGIAEHPPALWVNRFRAAAFALAGRKQEARQSFAELTCAYPDLTIGQVRRALPHTPGFCDRACEGLASLGMHP
ncbi:helix-turn-helix domain-containing protein [Bradyrhizobium sp. CB1650]|uniref:helix-turn-helix domain-containing protein n=1 Tax=Bradyrhizobium sp. CB1650 TaxID=3039153 RepID=UPI002434DA5E|nr:helix-turn-helix domain-containing protein [Bradyrhizobium sp. CB1650]WGD53408.1 helix-turn-helix domain-containing protein [Bradyrhizobium sp. CB1650]